MKLRRLATMALAGVMTLSLAVPAFAAGGDGGSTTTNMTTNITGGYAQSAIDVVVPTTGRVVINPYGMGVTVEKSTGAKATMAGQVMTAPMSVKNKTDMWLSVGAEVSATVPETSGVKLIANTVDGVGDNPEEAGYVAPATGKSAFVQLEVVQAPATVLGTDGDTLEDLVIDACANSDNWADAGKVTVPAKSSTQQAGLATLAPATMNSTTGAFASYSAGSIGLFRLSGDCVANPGKSAWADADTFTVTVAFSFVPQAAPSYDITYALTGATAPTVTSAKVGDTVSLTINAASGNTFDSLAVTDASGNAVTTTPTDPTNSNPATITFSFVMPTGGVTVTAVATA